MLENVNTSAEIIGITASILTIATFAMSGESRIRYVSIVATIFWTGYALMISSPSILLANVVIVAVHIYKLRKMNWGKDTKRPKTKSKKTKR